MTAFCRVGICLLLSSMPVFSRQENRVKLDVVVNDKSGKPVTGLDQSAFTILDNKQPQKILSFEALGDAATSGPVEIVLVVDSVNTTFTRLASERVEIKKFLQRDGGRLARPTSFAFFTDAGVKVQQAPSLDGNALITELDQNESGLRSIRRSQGFYGDGERWELSLRALGEICDYESKRPGKKMVVWISPGWPFLSGPRVDLSSKDQTAVFRQIVSLSAQLRQSRIVLYCVDPSGAGASTVRTEYYKAFVKGVRSERGVLFGNLSLQVLAAQSGGRVLSSDNDIAGEIERCIRDANADYVLSYDAVPADGPNDYHAIEVKMAQHDLKSQTRSGYYAQPDAKAEHPPQ